MDIEESVYLAQNSTKVWPSRPSLIEPCCLAERSMLVVVRSMSFVATDCGIVSFAGKQDSNGEDRISSLETVVEFDEVCNEEVAQNSRLSDTM